MNWFDALDGLVEPKEIPILDEVIEDLKSREKKGIETYGTTLDNAGLSKGELLQHLYEELLDAAMYIKALGRAVAKEHPEQRIRIKKTTQ
jgi:hypothetical protein